MEDYSQFFSFLVTLLSFLHPNATLTQCVVLFNSYLLDNRKLENYLIYIYSTYDILYLHRSKFMTYFLLHGEILTFITEEVCWWWIPLGFVFKKPVSPSLLKNHFSGYSYQLVFLFLQYQVSLHFPLVCSVSDDVCCNSNSCSSICKWFFSPVASFKTFLFAFLWFSYDNIPWCGFPKVFVLPGILRALWHCDLVSVINFRKFSAIITLNISSTAFSIFLFMDSNYVCVAPLKFFTQFLDGLWWDSFFHFFFSLLFSLRSYCWLSSSLILSSAVSSLLMGPSKAFFISLSVFWFLAFTFICAFIMHPFWHGVYFFHYNLYMLIIIWSSCLIIPTSVSYLSLVLMMAILNIFLHALNFFFFEEAEHVSRARN